MSELTTQSLSQLAALIRARQVSPVDIVQAHLDRIERLNPILNAIVTLAPDAIERAHEAEAALMRGDTIGLLHGVPLTVKDTIETKGLTTTSGSRVRANYVPGEDAPAVSRLRNAGAIILGKTNCAEMAASYDTENPVFGRANNPYDLDRTSGGSSGGEAAAITACLSPGGLGSDLMGSIRVPAHFCGIVGLKPTAERVGCEGHIPKTKGPASFGAAIGPMARRVEDVEVLFNVIAGVNTPSPDQMRLSDSCQIELTGFPAAWHSFDGLVPVTLETQRAVESAAHALKTAGLDVREEKPPGIEHGHELWTSLFARVAKAQMITEYSGRENLAGEFVKFILESSGDARTAPLDEFSKALDRRNQLRASLLEWMKDTPLIIAPVGAVAAFTHGTRRFDLDGQQASVFRAFSYSQTCNVFDLPSISIPAGVSDTGLPIGVQIIARPFEEELVLTAAKIVERELGGWQMPAPVPSTNTAHRV